MFWYFSWCTTVMNILAILCWCSALLSLTAESYLLFNEVNILLPPSVPSSNATSNKPFFELIKSPQFFLDTCDRPQELIMIIIEQSAAVPEVVFFVNLPVQLNADELLVIHAVQQGVTVTGNTVAEINSFPQVWAKNWLAGNVFAPNVSAIYTAMLVSNTTAFEFAMLVPNSGRNLINTVIIDILQRKTLDIVSYTVGESSVTGCMFHRTISADRIDIHREFPFATDFSLSKCPENNIIQENYYVSIPSPNRPNLCYQDILPLDRFDIDFMMQALIKSAGMHRNGTFIDVDERIACDARLVYS